jgi:hypothetical protein
MVIFVAPMDWEIEKKTGQMLFDFCGRAGFVITNTWFKKPKRRLYTWKAPGDQHQYQLDYIPVKQ